MKVYIKIGVPHWEEARSWGDYHYARAMAKALEELGNRTTIQILPEWNLPVDVNSDVTIHLMGLSPYRVKRGPLNVIWIISHPDKALNLNLEQYDLVFCASRPLAQHISDITSTPVHELLQFADTYHMYPDIREDKKTDLLFVGNSRKVFRQIVRDILSCSHSIQIWGSNWEMFLPAKQIRGTYFPYEEVRQLYSSCAILLNDHWDDMRRWNLINNRIYDALACKSLVISDHLDDIFRLFGDAVITYRDRRELCEKADYYLDQEEERREIAEVGFKKIIDCHGVKSRMAEMLEKLKTPGLKSRSFVGPFKSLRNLFGI